MSKSYSVSSTGQSGAKTFAWIVLSVLLLAQVGILAFFFWNRHYVDQEKLEQKEKELVLALVNQQEPGVQMPQASAKTALEQAKQTLPTTVISMGADSQSPKKEVVAVKDKAVRAQDFLPPEVGALGPLAVDPNSESAAVANPLKYDPTLPPAIGTFHPSSASAKPKLKSADVATTTSAQKESGDKKNSSSGQISHEMFTLLDTARKKRIEGDYGTAILLLSSFEQSKQDYVPVLLEYAECYNHLGNLTKANQYCQKALKLCSENDVIYQTQANELLLKIKNPVQKAGIEQATKLLTLSKCQVSRDERVTDGEKISLLVGIARSSKTLIDPSAVVVHVTFFDRINGERVEKTIAPEPTSYFHNENADWAMGEELLSINHFLKKASEQELINEEVRSYHGYLIKLYYQDKLQDVKADPADLTSYGTQTNYFDVNSSNPLLPPLNMPNVSSDLLSPPLPEFPQEMKKTEPPIPLER
jgi:tetratricopeptide (TPR) repeat protein